MLARRIFVLTVATILVGRTFHCLHTTAVLCDLAMDASQTQGDPLENPHDSDPNESGCICKVALIRGSEQLAAERSAAESRFMASVDRCERRLPRDDRPALARLQNLPDPPPIAGRALRAWLASLVI